MKNAVNNIRSRMKSPSVLEMTLMSGQGQENGGASSSKEEVQVEPKTYFANERTFIQWISAALLLLTVSSIMMGSGNYNATSSVIAFASLVLVGYAAFVYFRRVKLLQSGNAYGYLDHVGPTILAVGVGLGVFIVFADAIKGSEFLSFFGGEEGKDKDDRRFLKAQMHLEVPSLATPGQELEDIFGLQERDGTCSRYSINGINLLEYQPRDIILNQSGGDLIVATPQALVSHPFAEKDSSFLSAIPDAEIQSLTSVGDRLFALSVGPSKTELLEFNVSAQDKEIKSRILIQDSTSTVGSMVYVPSSNGKFLVYLDGTMHSYHLPAKDAPVESLTRTGGINLKVLNRGLTENDDPITAMEHFEGITYVLRGKRNTIEAWDLETATLYSEMPLPGDSKTDGWVGMAFQRREGVRDGSLRTSKMATGKGVYLHMPLDTFPPQLWSFRLQENHGENSERKSLSLPECALALN